MCKQSQPGAVKSQMKNSLPVLFAIVGLFAGTSANAALLSLAFISDPDIFSDGITVTYDAANDTLTAVGEASKFTDLSGSSSDITNGSFSLSAIIDDAGNFSSGSFSIGGSVGSYTSGTLLTGVLTAFGFEAGNPSFVFAVNATGGDAMGLYSSAGLTLNGTGFTTSFAADFGNTFATSNVKTVDPAVVPVPAAAWLFGSGLIGLVGVARRRSCL